MFSHLLKSRTFIQNYIQFQRCAFVDKGSVRELKVRKLLKLSQRRGRWWEGHGGPFEVNPGMPWAARYEFLNVWIQPWSKVVKKTLWTLNPGLKSERYHSEVWILNEQLIVEKCVGNPRRYLVERFPLRSLTWNGFAQSVATREGIWWDELEPDVVGIHSLLPSHLHHHFPYCQQFGYISGPRPNILVSIAPSVDIRLPFFFFPLFPPPEPPLRVGGSLEPLP